MSGFQLQRLGQIMEPEPGNPLEVEGVMNPAAVRGPDGHLYLFPRLVARDNYSRIGIVRVRFNPAGDPTGVERLGIALEPEADYELRPDGHGGCEDPRITFVERMQRYVMTYTAFSPIGPRIAIAVSEDLFHWKRLGLASFAPYLGIDFVHVDNKDASLFPIAIPNHAGKMQLAILHRPLFPGTRPEETACQVASRVVDIEHESIWISYCPTEHGFGRGEQRGSQREGRRTRRCRQGKEASRESRGLLMSSDPAVRRASFTWFQRTMPRPQLAELPMAGGIVSAAAGAHHRVPGLRFAHSATEDDRAIRTIEQVTAACVGADPEQAAPSYLYGCGFDTGILLSLKIETSETLVTEASPT